MAARPVGAQAPAANLANRATATVDGGISRVAGEWVTQAGGSLSFRISSFIELGGGGRIDLSHHTPTGPGSPSRLHFGYAGLQVTLLPAPRGLPGLRLGALLGAGNLDVRDPSVRVVLDSDNGAVLEPSAAWSLPLLPAVVVGGSLSWRFAYGFKALGGIESRDLSGPAFRLHLLLGPF